MLDIGFMEIFVIGALALIVVGPKDLPGLLRTVGQFVAKARGMAREFQRTMEDAARDADLGDVADIVKGNGNLNKLPFDNQIVDSMKEFERSVKAGVDGAKAEYDGTDAATSELEAPAVTKPEAAKAPTKAAAKTDAKPAAPKTAKKTAPRKAASGTSAKVAAAQPKAAAKKSATKAAPKKAAPAKKAASTSKATPEKSA